LGRLAKETDAEGLTGQEAGHFRAVTGLSHCSKRGTQDIWSILFKGLEKGRQSHVGNTTGKVRGP